VLIVLYNQHASKRLLALLKPRELLRALVRQNPTQLQLLVEWLQCTQAAWDGVVARLDRALLEFQMGWAVTAGV
jgi:hypothetical protein